MEDGGWLLQRTPCIFLYSIQYSLRRHQIITKMSTPGTVCSSSVPSGSRVHGRKKVGRRMCAQREVGAVDHAGEEAGESGRRVSLRRRG
jgi:hypothetical protein